MKLATDKIRAHFGGSAPSEEERKAVFARLGESQISELGELLPPGKQPEVFDKLRKGQVSFTSQARGDESKDGKPLMFAFGAEFVEVRIHRLTHEIRVPRMTGAFAAGRIINPRTAHSQYVGGMIWGMASALLEATEVDEKRGRYVNDTRGEYLIAVNADVPQVDVIMTSRGGWRGQSVGSEKYRRNRHRWYRRCRCQCRLSCNRQAHPEFADHPG